MQPTAEKQRWRPKLGLIVLLSLLIVVEGVFTVGRLVLASSPPVVGCTRDLQDRNDLWCRVERTASLSGTLPTVDQVTDAVGEPRFVWSLDSGYYAKSITGSRFTLFAICRGTGQMAIKVYDGATDTQRYDLTYGCDGQFSPEFHVPAEKTGSGEIYPGPFVLTVSVTGNVTTAEYFVR